MVFKKPVSTSSPFIRKFIDNHCCLSFFIWVLLPLMTIATSAHAQLLPNDTTEHPQESPAPEWPDDSLGRRTPRGTVEGFIEAVAEVNYTKAARYLNVDTTLQEDQQGPRLAQALQRLLDQQGDIIPYSWISDEPLGNEDGNLGPNLDRAGTATVNGETFDIIVEMTEGPQGGPIWLFSSQTVQRIPDDVEATVAAPLVDMALPAFLEENKWGGVPIGHWLAMLMLAALAYLLAWGITFFFLFLTPLALAQSR